LWRARAAPPVHTRLVASLPLLYYLLLLLLLLLQGAQNWASFAVPGTRFKKPVQAVRHGIILYGFLSYGN
jgi:hypothetical protein